MVFNWQDYSNAAMLPPNLEKGAQQTNPLPIAKPEVQPINAYSQPNPQISQQLIQSAFQSNPSLVAEQQFDGAVQMPQVQQSVQQQQQQSLMQSAGTFKFEQVEHNPFEQNNNQNSSSGNNGLYG